MEDLPLKLLGAAYCPYSRKMRAVLRYRRIPFLWVILGSKEDPGRPTPERLTPALIFPGAAGAYDEVMSDSALQIRRLEGMFEGRSVVPPHPALALFDALLEAFADGWLIKVARYRPYPIDILPHWRETSVPRAQVVPGQRIFEQSYLRWLLALDGQLRAQPFVMGARPGVSDFAIFGQFTQLFQDPGKCTLAERYMPSVLRWYSRVEDLSGIEVTEADWLARGAIGNTFRALLAEVGRFYAPYLLANADALARNEAALRCVIDAEPYTQEPVPYHLEQLRRLRASYAGLSRDHQDVVGATLGMNGCELLFRFPATSPA